jgi:hypothetical protein
MYTIILRHDGIDRNYPCENYYDAVVLFDALIRRYPVAEMWQGDKLVQQYNGIAKLQDHVDALLRA